MHPLNLWSHPVQPDPLPVPPFASDPVPPDLLAWARQTLDVEEFLDEMRQTEAGGGCPLESFIAELESRAGIL